MKTYIALLRGINISGYKKILMADLRILMQELNFENVQTYIQSGNIIFDFKEIDFKFLENQISEKIESAYGFKVSTIVKSTEEIESVIKRNLYLKDVTKELKKISVIFLSEIPSSTLINQLKNIDYHPEEFIIDKNIIYLYAANGFAESKLSINLFEKKLQVNATARNINTTYKLLELSKNN